MVDINDLSGFIRKQEYKLQAKIYTQKYERLVRRRGDVEQPIKLADGELGYHYLSDDGVWISLDAETGDKGLRAYELKFLH